MAADASLLGLMTFHFACYGAGTPHLDDFAQQAFKDRTAIAPEAFLAALPTALLGHPKGGALAVVGHVERAWSYSFEWEGAKAQTTVFESALRCLLDGHPVGSAMEYLNARYAELSTMLADQLEEIEFGAFADPFDLAGLWTANADARGYAILGDPAVRLPVGPHPG
jgi:Peptidase family C25